MVRETNLNNARLALTDLQIRARSEVRLAQDLVRTSERAFNSLRLAAEQAQEVLNITTFAFQAGATTNLEVIDAQRQARCRFVRRGRAEHADARATGPADGAGTVPAVGL